MTNIEQAMGYIAGIVVVVLVVYAIMLARIWRDLDRLINQPPPQQPQPAGDELGKVRENIERLLDVLEERSTAAERQLKQLIEEAKEAAKQIDEATAAAVKVLDRTSSQGSSAPVEAPASEPPQSAPPVPAEREQIPLPEMAANGLRISPDNPAADDALLEPLATERPAASFEGAGLAGGPPARQRMAEKTGDPLSAWAPYKPTARAKESPVELPPAEAVADEHVEPNEAPEADHFAQVSELADGNEELPDFQPFSIKPAEEPANTNDDFTEMAGDSGPVISAPPVQAYVYASELAEEGDSAHGDGDSILEEAASTSMARAVDAATGQNGDPYSAVYTLAELGVTDVSEIARRTGLGQTEVEMVLNLWRRQ